MLTKQDKIEIYNKLITKFSLEEKYPLSVVGKELSLNGISPRKFGYIQTKNLMQDIPEFIEIEDYEKDGHSNCNVIIHNWKEASEPTYKRFTSVSSDLKESENEMVSLSIFQKPETVSAPEKPEAREPENQNNNMVMSEPEYTKREKDYQFQNSRDRGNYYGVSYNRNYNNFSRNYGNYRRQDDGSQDSMVRSSSGSVRFTGTSSGSTFKSEPSRDEIAAADNTRLPENKAEGSREKEEESTFDRLAYLPQKVLDYLMRKGLDDPAQKLSEAYQKSLTDQTYQQRGSMIMFPISWEGNADMMAVLRKNEKSYGKPWYLSYVGYPQKEQDTEEADEKDESRIIPPGKSLENFADIGYWQEFLKELAELALPENWDYRGTRERGRYYILKKYIQYTFYRLQQEEKVSIEEGHFAAFNTGLVNNRYQDIYACFIPNSKHDEDPSVPEWKFESFAIAGQRGKDGYGKMLTSYFNPLPKIANYYTSISDLFYDLSAPLVTDYEHIIIDNIDRLPIDYLKECAFSDEEAQLLIEKLETANSRERKKQAYLALSNYIIENDRIYRRLKARMEDAIEIALKRVGWNFRTAVPCYYPKGNCMSLMLPLALADDTRTDAALVVLKNPSGSYQGQTILELEKAYLDARLICRPNNDWLSLEEINQAERAAAMRRYENQQGQTDRGETYRSDYGRVNNYYQPRYNNRGYEQRPYQERPRNYGYRQDYGYQQERQYQSDEMRQDPGNGFQRGFEGVSMPNPEEDE